jgi:hypothetical protein
MGAGSAVSLLCCCCSTVPMRLRLCFVCTGALPVARALDYGMQIMRGLASLHEERILVLDLKPAYVTPDSTALDRQHCGSSTSTADTKPEHEAEQSTHAVEHSAHPFVCSLTAVVPYCAVACLANAGTC